MPLLLPFCVLYASAQAPAALVFQPWYRGKPLVLEEGVASGDSVRISLLRFYVSRVQLLQNDATVWTDPQPAHLLDAALPESLRLVSPEGIRCDAIRFLLGIDSATNAAGVAGGDLDPVKGMYWAWQSGYINFKIEGTSARCNTRKHAFQFHLGGFLQGNGCARWVTLPLRIGAPSLILVDVTSFLEGLSLDVQPQIMSPGPDAVLLSQKAAGMFRTTALP